MFSRRRAVPEIDFSLFRNGKSKILYSRKWGEKFFVSREKITSNHGFRLVDRSYFIVRRNFVTFVIFTANFQNSRFACNIYIYTYTCISDSTRGEINQVLFEASHLSREKYIWRCNLNYWRACVILKHI